MLATLCLENRIFRQQPTTNLKIKSKYLFKLKVESKKTKAILCLEFGQKKNIVAEKQRKKNLNNMITSGEENCIREFVF